MPIFQRSQRMQNRLGVKTEWWEGDEIRRHLPMMRLEDVLAGSYNGKDGIVDPNSVVMGYVRAAQRMGVTAQTGVSVLAIQVKGEAISGVETTAGVVSTPVVFNAAGHWAGLVGRMAGVEIPITPLRRQWFTTTPLPEIPPDYPFVIDFAQSLYFHREGLGLLIGMSNPDEQSGFDQNVDPAWELANLDAATARMPALEKAGLTSHWAGLYEITPDAHPIFGVTPVDGFYVCTGFSGHGFMHGPVAGLLMAECLLDGEATTVDISMLDLARFAEGRSIREYNVV